MIKAIAKSGGGGFTLKAASWIRIIGGYTGFFVIVVVAVMAVFVWLPEMPELLKNNIQEWAFYRSIENAMAFSMIVVGFWFGQRQSSGFKRGN